MLYEWLQVLQAEPLNSNIRCIEIFVRELKKTYKALLNSNIRCIEIVLVYARDMSVGLLNSNIRCIEIIHTNP